MSNKKEQRLNITGMSCNHCVASVQNALKQTPGVESATVSLEDNSALVVYDPDIAKPEDFTGALADTNYTAALA